MCVFVCVCVCVCVYVRVRVSVCVCVNSPALSLQTNSSTELEQKFQNNPQEVVEFTAGSQTYTLSLQGEATVTPPTPDPPICVHPVSWYRLSYEGGGTVTSGPGSSNPWAKKVAGSNPKLFTLTLRAFSICFHLKGVSDIQPHNIVTRG